MTVTLLNGNHAINFNLVEGLHNTDSYYTSNPLNKIKHRNKIYVITNIRTGEINQNNNILWYDPKNENKQAPSDFIKDLIINNKLMTKILKIKDINKSIIRIT